MVQYLKVYKTFTFFFVIFHNSLPFSFYTFSSIFTHFPKISHASDSQIPITRLDTFTNFQICISNCLLDIPTYVSQKSFKVDLFRTSIFFYSTSLSSYVPLISINSNITQEVTPITTKSNISNYFPLLSTHPFSVSSLFLKSILSFFISSVFIS